MTTREQRRLRALWTLCLALFLAIVWLQCRAVRQVTPPRDMRAAEQPAAAPVGLSIADDTLPTTRAPQRKTPRQDSRVTRATGSGRYVLTACDAAALAALRCAIAAAGLQELGGIPVLRMLRVGGDADALARLLAELPDGVRAEEDRVVWLPEQDVTGWTGYAGMPFLDKLLPAMNIDRERSGRGDGVVIALLDTPLLAYPGLVGADISTYELFALDAEGAYAGHGSAVASLLLGQTAELAGIAPAASLLSLPVMSGAGEGSAFEVAEAIIAAVSAGADIISMSLGTYDDSVALRAAVAYAYEQGVVLIAAAGNDGLARVSYPAAYEQVVAVAAVDARWSHAGFSNSGDAVDIAAPGVGLYVAGSDGSCELFSGTSAAVPCVTGVLACVLADEPELSAQDAMALLLAYSNDNGVAGADPYYGEGVLAYERVAERDQSGIYDAALAGHAALPAEVTAGFLPIQISAQNRGTEPLPSMVLTAVLAGRETVFAFSDVQPGQVVSDVVSVDLELIQGGQALLLESTVSTPGVEDSKPGNETRRSVISMPAAADAADD